jgi:carbon monoxide dehydrogenase subunit G
MRVKLVKIQSGYLFIAIVLSLLWGNSVWAFKTEGNETKLERGEVVISSKKIEDVNFVEARILIDEPPSKVWPVMANPFEFQGKISPRMRQVTVVVDKVDLSLLKCTVHIGFFIPDITYTVESKYEPGQRITFKRTGGDLRDFKGVWEVKAAKGGNATELTYSMFIDPGIPVPQWIIREGVKNELPRTLMALRQRVTAIYTQNEAPEARHILAVSAVAKTSHLPFALVH